MESHFRDCDISTARRVRASVLAHTQSLTPAALCTPGHFSRAATAPQPPRTHPAPPLPTRRPRRRAGRWPTRGVQAPAGQDRQPPRACSSAFATPLPWRGRGGRGSRPPVSHSATGDLRIPSPPTLPAGDPPEAPGPGGRSWAGRRAATWNRDLRRDADLGAPGQLSAAEGWRGGGFRARVWAHLPFCRKKVSARFCPRLLKLTFESSKTQERPFCPVDLKC